MFCINCGAQLTEGDAFCVVCGYASEEEPAPVHGDYDAAPSPVAPLPEAQRSRRKLRPLYVVIAAAVVVIAVCVYLGMQLLSETTPYNDYMSRAGEAASSGNLDLAAELYRDALAEQPGDQDAQEKLDTVLSDALARGIGEVKAFLAEGNPDDAYKALRKLPISQENKLYGEYQQYLDALSVNPSVSQVDPSAFPTILVYVDFASDVAPSIDVSVTDGGGAAAVHGIINNDSNIAILYIAADSPGGEYRDVALTLTIGGLDFPLSGSYVTPEMRDAEVTLVSTDFSEYPLVRAFFRVKDILTQQSVANIGPDSFTISESVSGGAYVAREVKSAEPMAAAGGKYGINLSLVADKSDSIGSDMAKIKTVMTEFVGSLELSGGDRAELIAFDDVPQLMCAFTDDVSRLTSGINNMAIDGATAFYDAVYQGTRDAALQGGARCVIAFTDGEDNMSARTASDVIRFANEKQVPLYIIGVGNSSSHGTLQKMADETRGHYWYIDDLYDLSEIYAQIYGELLELYVVSYESDASADAMAERGLEVSMRGGGYTGSVNTEFTPSKTAAGGGASRYEIYVEDVSWEEASARCLERGGHLVTITSKAEEDQIIALAAAHGARYVWLGGYTSKNSNDSVFAHWITGEEFTYENWMQGEPSRSDRDGTPEWYLMLWETSGSWSWNDQRNELVKQFPYYSGKLAYVCEYEP